MAMINEVLSHQASLPIHIALNTICSFCIQWSFLGGSWPHHTTYICVIRSNIKTSCNDTEGEPRNQNRENVLFNGCSSWTFSTICSDKKSSSSISALSPPPSVQSTYSATHSASAYDDSDDDFAQYRIREPELGAAPTKCEYICVQVSEHGCLIDVL